MRKLNRMIAAGALAVPMALGGSGFAVADVAHSSGVPTGTDAGQDGGGDNDCGGLLGLDDLLGGDNGGDDDGGHKGGGDDCGILSLT